MTAWAVTVEAHTVTGPYVSYAIPAAETTTGGETRRKARWQACIDAHIRAGDIPRWKPYLRQSWPHVHVTPLESDLQRFKREHERPKKKA